MDERSFMTTLGFDTSTGKRQKRIGTKFLWTIESRFVRQAIFHLESSPQNSGI